MGEKYIFKSLSGRGGQVTIPYLGSTIGTITDWSLTRRGDYGPSAALYDLRAAFSFVSEALWRDEDYAPYRQVVIRLGSTRQYRLEQQPGQRTVLEGKSLLMEGVVLCPLEREPR